MSVYQISNNLKNQSDKELITILKSLYDSIYIVDCFGTSDLLFYDAISKELSGRGYQLNENTKIEVTKGGE